MICSNFWIILTLLVEIDPKKATLYSYFITCQHTDLYIPSKITLTLKGNCFVFNRI